ncbi:MAG TPA: methylated-DNA--[protein]-cysteine S-methyltransferase [Thermoanaerobaculia bacterium]|jgi:O-6-methylguanine DNA methyltransferase|nr:methylated-DNA--[protein]-cysteine S-methyltransferase [Thermoanaerobaculia bacterium]
MKSGKGNVSAVESLRGLPVATAPATLLPAVLKRIGLGDAYWRLESPVGPVFVAHSRAGISMVTRAASVAEFERAFGRRFGRAIAREKSPAPAKVRALVRSGRGRGRRELRYDLRGLSEFERAVLQKALEIPSGEVRPYSWIAREIGHPGAVRAAGSALAKNPVPLLIPCHRVVRSDGRIGHYSLGGARNKRRLLEVEGARPALLERLAASGVRYLGNPSGKGFCYPTCGGIEDLLKTNTVRFQSEREAIAAGYHPCRVCRPPVARAG